MNRKRTSYLAFLVLLALAKTTYAKTDISSLPNNLQQRLQAVFPDLENKELSPEQGDQLIQLIHQDPDVEIVQIISEDNGRQMISVKKSVRISKIEFLGNSKVNTSDLRDIFKLKEGDRFAPEGLVEGAENVRNFYKSNAWLNAIIDLEIKPDNDGNNQILLKIVEGEQSRINEFVFNSPNEKLNNGLKRLLKSYLKKPLTSEVFQDIQTASREWLSENSYFRTELKSPQTSFSADEAQARIQFNIEKYDQYLIRFEGNKNESTSSLEDIAQLDTYFTSNPAIASDLANKIRQYYLSQGFARIDINAVELGTKDPYQKRIEIRINEGERIRLLNVKVSGRTSHSEKWYYDFIQEHSSELIQKGFYAKEDLDSGLKNLILKLQNEGHLTAKLISSRIQYNDKKNGITLFLNMDEGPLTTVNEIRFEGNQSFEAQQLSSLVNLKPGQPLLLEQIELAIRNLKEIYQENGYIEMELSNERGDLVQYNDDNSQATLVFKIQEGPQVKISAIAVDGNTFTKTPVVLAELDLEDGEILTQRKMADATARLQRSGYFSSVEVKTLEEKTQVSNRTLLVKVRERDPGVFVFGGGANNEQILTLRGYIGVAYRNLWGTGRGVSLRLEGRYNVADVKYLERTVTAGYLEPHLFLNRLRGRVNISRSTAVTDYDLRKVTETNQTTYSLEREFTPNITGLYEIWSLATLKDFGIDRTRTVTPSLLDIATTGPALDIDFRDNAFNPTTGTLTRLKAEYSAPFLGSTQTIEYSKITGSFTHYLPFWKGPWVFANNVQAGYLNNLSTRSDGGVPYNKKGFILGGRSTVRGFESGTSEVFPNNTDLGSDNYILTKSASMYLVKSELRFPVWGSLAGAVFYDGGSVQVSGLKFADAYRDSAGFGIRYVTPFGPLNLEFAWKLDAKPSEEPMRFHLSIGTF